MLARHGVDAIADVRAFPGSRRHPHFNRETLSEALATTGVAYHHLPALGGRRRPRPDAPSTGWRVAGFRAYADYMATPQFAEAFEELLQLAGGRRCAVMCAEAVPWRCHRTLISDALIARGWRVLHIMSAADPGEHTLTSFARVHDGAVSYIAGQAERQEPALTTSARDDEGPADQPDLFSERRK